MSDKFNPPVLSAPLRQSHDDYRRRRVNPNEPRRRETSLSPIRRSGSPVRRQHISEIEEKARTLVDSGGSTAKRVKFSDNVQDDIEVRFGKLEANLVRRLDEFMESVNKRLHALEKKIDGK